MKIFVPVFFVGLLALGLKAEPAPQFRFAWPKSGCVPVQESAFKKGVTSELSYEICWKEVSNTNHLLISHKKFKVQSINAKTPSPKVAKLVSQLHIPDFYVHKNTGAFVMIEQKSMRASVSRMVKIMHDVQTDKEQKKLYSKNLVEQMLKDPNIRELVRKSALNSWNSWVGSWIYAEGGHFKIREAARGTYLLESRVVIDINDTPDPKRTIIQNAFGDFPALNTMIPGGHIETSAEIDRNVRPSKALWKSEISVVQNGIEAKQIESHKYIFHWKEVRPTRQVDP